MTGGPVTTRTEGQIQASIVEYLRWRVGAGLFFWRGHPTGPTRTKPIEENKGMPDLFVMRSGHLLGLEVKKPGEECSDDQLAWKRRLESAGGEYHVIVSVEDVERVLR